MFHFQTGGVHTFDTTLAYMVSLDLESLVSHFDAHYCQDLMEHWHNHDVLQQHSHYVDCDDIDDDIYRRNTQHKMIVHEELVLRNVR